MINKFEMEKHEALVRRIGLLIAAAALLVLFALAAYRLPLFHEEVHGTIIGISEVHNETGSELIAAVQLDTGAQVLVSMPRSLLNSESNNVRIDESRTLSGRRSYRIITQKE